MASEHGYLEIVQTLLGRGADVHHSNLYNGDTALHLASEKGHIEVVRALLEAGAGADVRRLNEDGDTPISRACQGKHMEVFRALVEAGGDVNTPDSLGDTALHNASRYGFTEGVRYLVERGADVNMSSTDGNGDTPLTLASNVGTCRGGPSSARSPQPCTHRLLSLRSRQAASSI
jgi:ankyrin repeat protein